ncbi:MAG: hypothetical protein H0W70_14485, partial [Actinobacteria bacterium]|nr:hypothetical protein [Actinomycetota bacterium]
MDVGTSVTVVGGPVTVVGAAAVAGAGFGAGFDVVRVFRTTRLVVGVTGGSPPPPPPPPVGAGMHDDPH